jgi:GTPase
VQERNRGDAILSEKAMLVRVNLPHAFIDEQPLDELEGLVETAGAVVVGGLVQNRQAPDPATYLGSGKVDELKRYVEFHSADVVIFDNDLSPAQTRNLEKHIGAKVLDRTELILDIFATHAQTYESRLAVELAQLEYSLPRLKRMWTHLSRMKMGVGTRGPGEKQLEVDRRLVEKRIHELRSELTKVEERKQRQVAGRRDFMTVSIVGYTNAGKSTLMNSLTDAEVLAEDKLFATLDTRTRRWQLPSWGPVLLSDTVGFIRDLPHHLIASFKATLEETRQADLLLHVVDGSSPQVFEQIKSVFYVLEELGIGEKGTLLIINKMDHPRAQEQYERIINRYPHGVPISARTKQGFDRLAEAVSDALSRSFRSVMIETKVSNGKLLAYIAAHAEVNSRRYEGDRVYIECRMPQKYLGRIHDPDTTIRDLSVWISDEDQTKAPTKAISISDDVSVSDPVGLPNEELAQDLTLGLSPQPSVRKIEDVA